MPYPWQPGMKITASRLRSGMLAGTVTINFSTSIANTFFNAPYFRDSADVTFPAGFFTNTPNIIVAGRSTTPGVLIECSYSNQTPNGFTVWAARSTNTGTVIDWVALDVPG
ncbi:hypothetical protein [Streptomyces sp. NRRL B-24720]|uniref:hypothetical protein n=1 Tax=Streptomyces sp. NRRL B-24720 TaxID=1476876 RepID=UPI0004C939FA|nr:hypothetical protein [Streptomyces sp. NRRL B-24720]